MSNRLQRLTTVLVGLGATCVLGLGAAGLADAHAPSTSRPGEPRPVIVDVTGDAANGFDVTYADGDSISPPTDSEARAECGEYDRQTARVRCRSEVRTWYRDLGDLQRSLAYVRAHE